MFEETKAPVDVLAVLDRKRAPLRDMDLRRVYDACVAAYKEKGAAFMAEGNSAAGMFRRGFTDNHVGKWDAASRKTFPYAQFRAGQDCAADEARAAVAELVEAAGPFAENVPEDAQYKCHRGICSARECGRCGRAYRLYAALARVGGGK